MADALVAGLQYGLSSKNTNERNSLIFVKLTDSAYKAIEEYLRNGERTKQKPTIQFLNNEGHLSIPSAQAGPHGRVFNFNLSPTAAAEEGTFDCLRSGGGRSLQAVGTFSHQMWIQANEDVYEKTKQRMTVVEEQNKKNCTQVIKPNTAEIGRKVKVKAGAIRNGYNSLPPQQPTQQRVATQPISLHSRAVSNNHAQKPGNPEVMRRPIKERLIHLLAVKPYKKPELLDRIHKEGIKDREKRMVSQALSQITTMRDNTYHLIRSVWNEVQEDWPFYTEQDRQLLKRRKPQNLTPPGSSDTGSSGSGQSPSSTHPGSPPSAAAPSTMPSTKRPGYFETADGLQSKRQRISHYKKPVVPVDSGPPDTKFNGYSEAKLNGYSELKPNGYPDSKLNGYPESKMNGYPETKMNGYPETKMNGYTDCKLNGYPDSKMNDYPDSKLNVYSESKLNIYPESKLNGYPEPKMNGYSESRLNVYPESKLNGYPESKMNGYPESKMNGYPESKLNVYPESKLNGYPESKMNGYSETKLINSPESKSNSSPGAKLNGSRSSPSFRSLVDRSESPATVTSSQPAGDMFSPESPQPLKFKELGKISSSLQIQENTVSASELPEYVMEYTPIKDDTQRRRYKEDFNADYDEYKKLHAEVEKVSQKFSNLETELQRFSPGTCDYKRVKRQVWKEYQDNLQNTKYHDAKRRFLYLHEKLSHIKKLVAEYDRDASATY